MHKGAMRSLANLAVLIMLFAAAPTSWGAGFPSLDGKLSTGTEFSIHVELEPPMLTIHRLARKADESTGVEGCQFSETGDGRKFACAAGTPSPFAGMTYKSRPGPGTCDKPEYYYRCVKGCKSGAIAPKVLTQGWWECEE